ncbi:MAG: polysaccharide biosynthesis protein [bacterium]|nr:polysaccharide biosynthesis protein [bacterium]
MKLKRNSFMQGAFIATFGIILCKIMGILYVIPFYSIIGEQGGALYGYAYNIYSIFLSISQAGIPLAMSKVISEYNTLGYFHAKEKAYKLGKKLLFFIGLISFVVLFIFADKIGYLIIGNVAGGNTKEDVAFVIRLISTAILIIPTLSVTRGYFQGHKFITPTSISQIIEQLIRVCIIVVGSFLMYKVFHFSLKSTVGCAVFAATIGGLISYMYLHLSEKKNKKMFLSVEKKVKEPIIKNSNIIKKILFYAVPFIMIELFRSLYNSIDVMMLVKVLVNDIGYSVKDAESIMSVISTWGLKINMIIISIVTGLMTSLIPNLTSSFVKGDMNEVEDKVNKTYQIVLFFAVPMSVGLSYLAKPVWTIFYGISKYGPLTYQYYVFVALATALFTSTLMIIQLLKDNKTVFISLCSGMLVKCLLNIPLIYSFNKMGLPAFYGAITTTILGFVTSVIICLFVLKNKFNINFEKTIKEAFNILIAIIGMILSLVILNKFISIDTITRFKSIIIVAIYSFIGALVYLLILYKTNTIFNIFGEDFVNKIIKKSKKNNIK